MAFQDLARSRVHDRRTVRPAPRRAVHPLDDVVAHIHRVGARGQHLDTIGVAVAGRLECLRPPARTVEQRGSHRLRCARIEVVDNRLDGLANLGGRVHFFEPVPAAEIAYQRLTDRRGVVEEPTRVVAQADDAAARFVGQRFVAVVRQADKGMVHVDSQCIRVRRNAAQVRPCPVADERDDRFDFGVVGERLRARQVYGRPRIVCAELAFSHRREARRYAVCVTQEKRGCVYDGRTIAGVDVREAPYDRPRERLFDRLPFIGVLARGPVAEIVLDQQDFRSAAQEANDPGRAELAAVEADVV